MDGEKAGMEKERKFDRIDRICRNGKKKEIRRIE